MTPLRIGACLETGEIAAHEDWLFDSARDIDLQDFMSHAALTSEFEDRVTAVIAALNGHLGRVGIHDPFEGLDMDSKHEELQPLITARFLKVLDAAERIGVSQMVLHSPFTRCYQHNILSRPRKAESKHSRIHDILAPVVARAENAGITLVIENIQDVRAETRREMDARFNSKAIALSIDTGHAQLSRRISGGLSRAWRP